MHTAPNMTTTSTQSTIARNLFADFAHRHDLVFGGFAEMETKGGFAVFAILGKRYPDEGGRIGWFEPSKVDGTFAFSRMPKVIFRADGSTVEKLFNPFAA